MEEPIFDQEEIALETLPVVPLRGMTAFPKMLLHFDVERPMSIGAINAALAGDQRIFLLTQREIQTETPGENDLYFVGTICKISQILRVPGHGMRVMVEGECRAQRVSLFVADSFLKAEVSPLEDAPAAPKSSRVAAYLRQCEELFSEYMALIGNQVDQPSPYVQDDISYIADYIAQGIFIRHEEKQELLEECRPMVRLKRMIQILAREVEVLEIKHDLQERTSHAIFMNQKEYYLREQLKLIRSELGEFGRQDEGEGEFEEYRKKILQLALAQEETEKLLKEVSRLEKQPFGSSEGALIRAYLDTVLELPWNKKTKERLDISAASRILEADHFGMAEVKERILEFLAVRQLNTQIKGGIICLLGPPGVGKTSVATSIAKATGRNFARISLGGVHDEAEIRGHRKTYLGAMPGRIIAAIRQAKSQNPLILLDEIDKLGKDHRGDPASALLETLDAEQNSTFRDHYLELPFDLSEVLFITTANSIEHIPRPLLDRMEVIELGSYTDEEKLQIAKKYLLPKQRKRHGITAVQLKISDEVLRDVIAGYTRESGVRQLERQLAKICRKTASRVVQKTAKTISLKSDMLQEFLGVRRYKKDPTNTLDEIGLANGLAWTSVGGELLQVEVQVVEGSGKLELTGNLGDVMKESAKAALSYIRSRTGKFGLASDFYKTKDIHIHFPEGAIPKDGPSAGITIATAMISALTNTPCRRDVAMTGEITLRGRVLSIGGLKEKTMAAHRLGITKVILPLENEKDLEEIDPTVKAALNFVLVDHMDSVMEAALCLPPEKKKDASMPNNLPMTSGGKPRGRTVKN